MLAELPVHLAEPVDQLAAIRARMEALKESREADAGWMLTALAGVEPFPAFAWPARFVFAHPQRTFTTVTTNVPGPRRPLYALGRPMVDLIPYVPIGNPVRVGVSILTYADGIRFGITADWDTVPDIEVLATGIDAGLRALAEAAAREVAGPPAGDTR
jgi:diacylglycerol O-acyltransferase